MSSLHALQWAVSHNSYNTAQQFAANQLPFDVEHFYEAGFRGIELDIVQDGARAEWIVTHNNFFSSEYKLLSAYLDDLRNWSERRRHESGHDLLFIHLDCKANDVTTAFPDQLDGYIEERLLDQPLYTPADMLLEDGNLMQGAMQRGWPELSVLEGKFVFVLSGQMAPKARYAMRNARERLCFADVDKAAGFPTGSGTRVIANCQQTSMTERFGKWLAGKQGLLCRTYKAESAAHFDALAATGANMIAADDVFALPRTGYWDNPLVQQAIIV